MARTLRKNFTDRQKAEIFVRDRAICAFSGKSLWVLDYGLSPTFDVDWVDHIKPASKGGGNEIENGICASSFYNSKKNDNSRDNSYLFHNGKPTSEFYYHFEVIPNAVADHIERFSSAAISDWYFNRAASRFLYGLSWLVEARRGNVYVRDDHYYSKSTLSALVSWRKKSQADRSFESRGLISKKVSEDQKTLLKLRDLETEVEILQHMRSCDDWYENGMLALDELAEVGSEQALTAVLKKYCSMPRVPKRVISILEENSSRLKGKLEISNDA